MKTHKILLVLLFVGFSLSSNSQSAKKLVDKTVQKEKIEAAISFIASDELRGRDTPSPELDIAAKYLATFMAGSGVKTAPGMETYFQDVEMKTVTPPSNGVFSTSDKSFSINKNMIYLGGEPTELNTEVIYLGYGLEDDYTGKNVEGKIVIVKAGIPNDNSARAGLYNGGDKVMMAMEKGAAAIIELYSGKQPNFQVLMFYMAMGDRVELDLDIEELDHHIPYLWLDDTQREIEKYFTSYSGSAELTISGNEIKRFTTRNVIGYVEGIDSKLKDEIVIYSAHYDHIGVGDADMYGDSIFNGTRDNAVGTVTVMEAARNIAKYPLKRSALFIFFTGEEKGLLGSQWYVEYPVVPLEQVVYCFNSDNAGYNDTTAATIIGLERTTASKHIKEACATYGLRTTGDPAPEQNLFDRSDQVSFARKGVPALMYSMGMKDFGEEILKYYHKQSDNPDSVDYDYLFKFTKAYVLACRLVGNMKERPYWVKGDKYYKAGEQLYKK